MTRTSRTILVALLSMALGGLLLPVVVVEGNLHVFHRPAAWTPGADTLTRETGAPWEDVKIQAADGETLDAWLFTPPHPNGAAVILLHGVVDTRMGMSAHADFLLRSGFTVLTPDCRGHGASGGNTLSYGIRDADDVHRWADLLLARPGIRRLYGLGQSMGAAILIEALPREPRLRALVADCPFATFEEVAYDRLEQRGLPPLAAWPIIQIGFAYTRLRYGFDLREASPAAAIRATRVPVLLIHGVDDQNIPIRHSRELHALNPAATQLWEVAGAGHISSLRIQPDAYRERVLAFFRQ